MLDVFPCIVYFFYHNSNVLPLPSIIIRQVTICNNIQNVRKANAFFTSVCVIGKNSGLSSSVIPIGIPTVLAHNLRNRLCPDIYLAAKSDCNLMLSINSSLVAGSFLKAPLRTVVCVKLLCAIIPLFSQHPCVA